LQELPLYSEYVPDPVDEKSQIFYDFYNRNTIGWPLECDKDLHRSEVVRLLQLIQSFPFLECRNMLYTLTALMVSTAVILVLLFISVFTKSSLVRLRVN